MLNSSNQTLDKLQQKIRTNGHEQKDEELEHERSLWKTRRDVDIHADAVSVHTLLDNMIDDETMLRAMTPTKKNPNTSWKIEKEKQDDAPLFCNNKKDQELQSLSSVQDMYSSCFCV